MHDTDIQKALGACRGGLVVLVIFSFAINLLALASPLYMIHLYDHVLPSGSIETLVMLTVIVVAALAIHAALDGLRRRIAARLGTWLDDRLGPPVLALALRNSLRWGSAAGAQDLRDLATFRGFFSGSTIMPLLDIPWTPLFLLALFALHPLLGLVGGGGLVFQVALALANEVGTRRPLARAGTVALAANQRTEAALRNAEVIRALGMAGGLFHRWRRDGEAARGAQETATGRGTVILALSRFFRLSVQAIIMGTGAWLVLHHEATAGVIFAGSFLLSRSLAPLENAIGTWKSLVTTRTAYRRLTERLASLPQPLPAMDLPPPDGAVSAESVSFVPQGAERATLANIHFTLEPGEVMGVVGPSAAGKSTLARLLVGAWRPTAGHVRLDGADVSVWLDAGGARHIGYLPQDIELFAGSVRDNIARLTEGDPAEVIEAARLVGLHETIMRLPRGYDTDIGEDGVRLSGGQRQRVGLARALYGAPRLVVLDEPNSSLDFEGEEALRQAILHLKANGTTVVVIAHRPSVLNLADKLLVMRQGVIDAFGPRTEIVARLNAAAASAAEHKGAVLPQRSTSG
ncbi:MAG TPA: type I secretion system permease/ATPase [Azospirillaceae bacterium]|nr:type I secretion system permease/ATPase [Azospirillaceae bacterium]